MTTGTVAAEMPFRFSTHYTDEETGLVYAKRRYYSAASGRWLSRDPVEEDGGPNLYAYVGNNPVHKVDPFGLFDPATGTAYELGLEWMKGTAPDQVNFRDGDRMTEQIRQSQEVSSALREIQYQLQNRKCGVPIGPIRVVRSLSKQTFWQHAGYPFDYFGDVVWPASNPTRGFLGSLDGTATLVYVDCCKGIARIEIHLFDTPRLGSATQLPWTYANDTGQRDVHGPRGTLFRSFRVNFLFHSDAFIIPREEDRNNGIHIFLPPNLPLY